MVTTDTTLNSPIIRLRSPSLYPDRFPCVLKDKLENLPFLSATIRTRIQNASEEISSSPRLQELISHLPDPSRNPLLVAGIVLELHSNISSITEAMPRGEESLLGAAQRYSPLLELAHIPWGSFDYSKLIDDIENTPTQQILRDGVATTVCNTIFRLTKGKVINATLRNIATIQQLNDLLFPIENGEAYPKYQLMAQPRSYSWGDYISENNYGTITPAPERSSSPAYMKLVGVVIANGGGPTDTPDILYTIDHALPIPNVAVGERGSEELFHCSPCLANAQWGTCGKPFVIDSEESVLRALRTIQEVQNLHEDTDMRNWIKLEKDVRGHLSKYSLCLREHDKAFELMYLLEALEAASFTLGGSFSLSGLLSKAAIALVGIDHTGRSVILNSIRNHLGCDLISVESPLSADIIIGDDPSFERLPNFVSSDSILRYSAPAARAVLVIAAMQHYFNIFGDSALANVLNGRTSKITYLEMLPKEREAAAAF